MALLTNTLPCACYFSWHTNTPQAHTNTVHIYIYLLRGSHTEQTIEETIEETIEDQSQHSAAQKAGLSAASLRGGSQTWSVGFSVSGSLK